MFFRGSVGYSFKLGAAHEHHTWYRNGIKDKTEQERHGIAAGDVEDESAEPRSNCTANHEKHVIDAENVTEGSETNSGASGQ